MTPVHPGRSPPPEHGGLTLSVAPLQAAEAYLNWIFCRSCRKADRIERADRVTDLSARTEQLRLSLPHRAES